MTYVGMSWIDEDLQAAIAGADDDQEAFALAATALIGTVRVGLDKLTADVTGLMHQQAATARASDRVADALERQTAAFKQAQGLHTGETVPAEDYDPHYKETADADDDLVIAPLGGGGFVIGRRDDFKDEEEEEG